MTAPVATTADGEIFNSKIGSFTKEDFAAETITPLADLKNLAATQMKYKMELYVTHLHAEVMKKLAEHEPVETFRIDPWARVGKRGKGGGITCVLQGGMHVFFTFGIMGYVRVFVCGRREGVVGEHLANSLRGVRYNLKEL